jgi:2-dehydropantoate 2-reductase
MDTLYLVGLGGIGTALSVAMIRGGASVVAIEKNPAKVEAARRSGLAVDRLEVPCPDVRHFEEWTPSAGGVVFLCTKCYDNREVLNRLPESVTLIPVQNGFDPDLDAFGHALEGIASFVSECEADRPRTRITRPGCLHFGHRRGSPPHPLADSLAETLERGGLFPVKRVPVIEPFKYTKLMYNAAISPLAAAAGIDNGKLLSVPRARRLFFDLLQENYAILEGAGVELGKIGPFHPRTVAKILRRRWVARLLSWAFEPSLRGTYCSMAPDLPKGRTEIAHYNRHLVRIAGATPCPLNRAVVALIERMERERIQPHREMLHRLESAIG